MTFEAIAPFLGLPNPHCHLYMKFSVVRLHICITRHPHDSFTSLDLLVHPASPPAHHASLGNHGGFSGNVSRLQVG